jgi:hypothetical protein
MDMQFKKLFIEKWEEYFGGAELPITFAYSDNPGGASYKDTNKNWNCLISELMKVRNGESLAYNINNIACGGAKRFLGYTEGIRPGFEYFLSHGNEEIEGERYKCTPELAKVFQDSIKTIPANNRYSIFKRWDKLEETDEPEIVIFFAKPDVLSGLFTLANFDQSDANGVISPFGAGCGSIIYYPYRESKKEDSKCVLGMFDVSARPGVQENILTFSTPFKRFETMVNYMDESFLITEAWKKVKKRIGKHQ